MQPFSETFNNKLSFYTYKWLNFCIRFFFCKLSQYTCLQMKNKIRYFYKTDYNSHDSKYFLPFLPPMVMNSEHCRKTVQFSRVIEENT